MELSRKTHCDLAGIPVHSFKALQHLGRVPVLEPPYRGERGFTPLETIALVMASMMADESKVAWERAAGICSRADVLLSRWSELKETVAERRIAGKREILFGRVEVRDPSKNDQVVSRAVVGTFAEIAAEYDPTRAFVISASRVAEIIRNRAERLKIDLSQFWTAPIPSLSKELNSSRIRQAQPRASATKKRGSHPKRAPNPRHR